MLRASAPNCARASTNPSPRSPRLAPNVKWPRIRFGRITRCTFIWNADARSEAVNFNSTASLLVAISQIDVAKNEISAAELQASRAQQNLTAKSLEFERLQVCLRFFACNQSAHCVIHIRFCFFWCAQLELNEVRSLAAKLAQRVFELKQKQEMSELPIRRFPCSKVSASLLLTPALVCIVLLLCLLCRAFLRFHSWCLFFAQPRSRL